MSPIHLFRTAAARALLSLVTVITAGCESALFRFANRGLEAPEATVVYAPDLALSLDIYRPIGLGSGHAHRGAPTVLFFYGGGWQRGERAQYQFIGRRLAQHGILAVVADYRTYPQAVFPAFVDDAARAVAWTRGNAGRYGGDARRVFLAGHSAGAQIAALLATDPRHLGRHAMRPAELAGVIGLAGPYDFVIHGQYVKVFGPPAQWPQAQAINFVDGDEPPFLLIHGSNDRVVEARDSQQLADRLRRNGVDAELLLLDDAGHSAPLLGMYDPARSPDVLPAILRFVRNDMPPST